MGEHIYPTVVKCFQISTPSRLPKYPNYFDQCQTNHLHSKSRQVQQVLGGTGDCVLWIFEISSLFMFFRSGNPLIRPKKKYVVFPVTRPTPIFGPDPKVFIQIFLFLIKSCIILFVCQTRLGSLGVLYELYTTFLIWHLR